MDRRSFLASAVTASAAALAGCTASAEDVPPPEATADAFDDRWELIDANGRTVFEESYGGVTLVATEHRVTYEQRALRERTTENTLGRVDASLALFFATRIDFAPSIDSVPVAHGEIMDRIEAESKASFEAQLREAGLEDVREVGEGTLRIDTGHDADRFEYAATAPLDGFSFDLGAGEGVELDLDGLEIAGELAVWHDGEDALVAGGIHPAENLDERIEEDLTPAIDVTVEIDMGFAPEEYEEELLAIMRSVR